jgi:hypothetical protein
MTREEIDQLAKRRHIEAQFRPDAWHEELTAFAIEIANAALEEAAKKAAGYEFNPRGGVAEAIRALKVKV